MRDARRVRAGHGVGGRAHGRAPTVGRRDVRARAGPAADGVHQLGPVRRRADRRARCSPGPDEDRRWPACCSGSAIAAKFYPLFLLGPLLLLCLRAGRMRAFGRLLARRGRGLAGRQPAGRAALAGRLGDASTRCRATARTRASARSGTRSTAPAGSSRPTLLNAVAGGSFALLCLRDRACSRWARRGARGSGQLAFLVVAAFIITNKVYSPQYVLWLIALVPLARPRWRDFLIWQAAEVVYFVAVWWHLQGLTYPDRVQVPEWTHNGATFLRIAVLGWVCGLIVRDVLRPEHDPVRADGSDDPAGGVLDGAPDRVPARPPAPTPATAASRRRRGRRWWWSSGRRRRARCRRRATGSTAGSHSSDTCMCGGSANQRRAPPTRNGDSERPTASSPPAPADPTRWPIPPPVGRRQRDAVRRAAGDDHQVPGPRGPALPVAVPLAAARPRARRAPSPRACVAARHRATAGCRRAAAASTSGSARGGRRELGVGQVAHPQPRRPPARARRAARRPPTTSATLPPGGGSSGRCRAKPSTRVSPQPAGATAGQLVVGQPEPAHRRQQLDDDPVPGELVAAPAATRRCGRSRVVRRRGRRSTPGRCGSAPARRRRTPPRTAVDLAGQPDRDRAGTPSRAASAASRAQAEAVAVALHHRDQAGHRRQRRRLVCARQRAPSTYRRAASSDDPLPAGQVELESLVQQRGERVVPLAQVLDRLAARAQLELDEAEQVVVDARVCRRCRAGRRPTRQRRARRPPSATARRCCRGARARRVLDAP